MGFIKNFSSLAKTPDREKILTLVESAFTSIQSAYVTKEQVLLQQNQLHVQDTIYDLSKFDRIFVVGFGKGSGSIAKILEDLLGERLTDGYVIDDVVTSFTKIHFTQGTHPLPSQTNIDATKEILAKIHNLTEKDLVLVVVCGGGSAIFEVPATLDLAHLDKTFTQLLDSGATIAEMNVVRKHLSLVKGGGFAKHLYPATVVSLLYSDVPGNNMSVIASGPTVPDNKTIEDAVNILEKYHINAISKNDLVETPKDPKYFASVHNTIIVSNMTALKAMEKKAKELGLNPRIFSDRVQGDAKEMGKQLITETKSGELLLAGGETTVHVTGKGRGGRNQEVVLGSLPFVGDNTIVVSFDSDGIDFDTLSGAIGDYVTVEKAKELGLDSTEFLKDDNALPFWEKTGDGILTGALPSNVSDLFIVYKK